MCGMDPGKVALQVGRLPRGLMSVSGRERGVLGCAATMGVEKK